MKIILPLNTKIVNIVYFIALIASSVTFSLSNFFIIKTKIVTNKKVIPYMSKLKCQFPESKLEPASVEDITEGNLAIVEIKINSNGLIGSSAAIYVNRSFGVPGIKNKIKIINLIVFGFLNALLFSIYCILLSSIKL